MVVDYGRAVRILVDHLVGLGHRRLAFLSGPPASASNTARLRSLEVAEREIPGLEIVRLDCGWSIEDGYAAVERVLESHVTAVVAFNDLVAFGLLARLNEVGVAVPADLSVTGMDDIGLSRFAVPSLTTVRVPQKGLGELAWQRMHAAIAGSDVEADDVPELRLAVRASTGPVPQAPRLQGEAPAGRVGWQRQGDTFELGSDSGMLARYEFGRRMPECPLAAALSASRPDARRAAADGGQPGRPSASLRRLARGRRGQRHVPLGRPDLRPGPGPDPAHEPRPATQPRCRRRRRPRCATTLTWYDEQGRPQLVERRRLRAHWPKAAGGSTGTAFSPRATDRSASTAQPPRAARTPGTAASSGDCRPPTPPLSSAQPAKASDAAFGSLSPWLAFVQRRADVVTTLLLVQPGDVRPWFLRSSGVRRCRSSAGVGQPADPSAQPGPRPVPHRIAAGPPARPRRSCRTGG